MWRKGEKIATKIIPYEGLKRVVDVGVGVGWVVLQLK